MKIEKMKAGMVVYDVHRYKMGNTTMSTVGIWHVYVKEVNCEQGYIVASWNGNAPEKIYRNAAEKFRKKEPLLVKVGLTYRLATREEVKAGSSNGN